MLKKFPNIQRVHQKRTEKDGGIVTVTLKKPRKSEIKENSKKKNLKKKKKERKIEGS